jgi:hypothetical protein
VPPFVSAWKERGLRVLAEEAADVIASTLEPPAVAVLAFVPPDGDRSLKRAIIRPSAWRASSDGGGTSQWSMLSAGRARQGLSAG